MSPSRLHAIPAEILSNVALYLACDDPFRPPLDLCSLLATSRSVYHVLHHSRNGPLWAAAFKYRFDDAAVVRRNFLPSGSHYAEQLRLHTETLAAIRSMNVYTDELDLANVLRMVYIMLLENNGKNRAQLEAVGLDVFVDIYVRTRLWFDSQSNEGWPRGHDSNAHALWILWMLTTPQKIAQESPEHREHLIALLLPYVVNVYRYPQAEAPPCHFHLPLPPPGVDGALPFSVPSAHGPYPVYVRPDPTCFPYFGSMPVMTPPLIAVAAKLLYISRREAVPLDVLDHFPRTRAEAPPSNEPSPTQEDVIEFNSHKAAQPPPRVTWDWDRGCKVLDGRPVFFSSSFDHDDDSIRWDCDYWRRRLCGDAWQAQPKWRPGKVYVPGSMDGLWHGRLIFPAESSMHHLATRANFPHYANFNEFALAMTHQPLYMRLKEHHALGPHPHVPLPPRSAPENNASTSSVDRSMCNAWLPGVPNGVAFTTDPLSSPGHPLYSANGERKKVLISIENHPPPRDQPPNGWIYQTYDRQLAAQQQREADLAGRELKHTGHEQCLLCRERDALVQKGAALDYEDRWYDSDNADQAMDDEVPDDQGLAERLFESVGLGRDQVDPSEVEFGMEDVQEGNDYAMEFLADNADYFCPHPIRRATDRVKIEKCDGIRDIVFSGTTDRRHALAWNDFTFHGRVRPWDGLIGILRRSAWPVTNYMFFYGYLIGGDTFVGNWRLAAYDPNVPTWESTFVMSRRKDEDGA